MGYRGATNGWLTVMTLDPDLRGRGVGPMDICDALAAQEIEARPSWKPMHQQKLFADAPLVGGAVADDLFDSGSVLAKWFDLSEADLDRVISALRGVLG
ncbi:MAG: DegT/DnrJ/EryC1/StrS family aminotransferase [Microthrixaceae bacterium]